MSNLRFSLLSGIAGLCVCVCNLEAAPRAVNESSFSKVAKALQAEIDGNPLVRTQLLESVLKQHPQCRIARWNLGQIEWNGEWIDYAGLPARIARDEAVHRYRTRRKSLPATYRDQLEIANWCQKHGLPIRERAHLTAALELSDNPNDPVLRSRLGFKLVDGIWLRRDEIAAAKQSQFDAHKNLGVWKPKIRRLSLKLNSRRNAIRQTAKQDLRAISDRNALPALEAILSTRGLEQSRLLVELLGPFPSHRAVDSLTRLAMYSPWKVVREESVKQLRTRPFDTYVPALVASLRTQVYARISLFVGQGGVYLLQQFSNETQSTRRMLDKRSSLLIRQIRQGATNSFTGAERDNNRLNRATSNAALRARLEATASQKKVDAQNDATKQWNDHVCWILGDATGIQLQAEPQHWWGWWCDYNQMTEEDKEYHCVCYHEVDMEMIPTGTPIIGGSDGSAELVATTPPRECLVAGTPIWTDRGRVAVEKVRIGDMVLSKHPETGELRYQPVLRTTIRKAEPVMQLTTTDGEIRATGGHTFWISGKGWTKLRDIKLKQRLHGASGTAQVIGLKRAGMERTYNLVVADYHTYFVGNQLVLSHDVTFARPVDNSIPGVVHR